MQSHSRWKWKDLTAPLGTGARGPRRHPSGLTTRATPRTRESPHRKEEFSRRGLAPLKIRRVRPCIGHCKVSSKINNVFTRLLIYFFPTHFFFLFPFLFFLSFECRALTFVSHAQPSLVPLRPPRSTRSFLLCSLQIHRGSSFASGARDHGKGVFFFVIPAFFNDSYGSSCHTVRTSKLGYVTHFVVRTRHFTVRHFCTTSKKSILSRT